MGPAAGARRKVLAQISAKERRNAMASELANVRQLVRQELHRTRRLPRDRPGRERGQEDMASEDEGLGPEAGRQEPGQPPGM